VRAALARRWRQGLHEAEGEEGGKSRCALSCLARGCPRRPGRSTFTVCRSMRFVVDRALLHALAQGYGELLEKGRYPLPRFFVDVPGQELLNVHPQKLEVRFSRRR